MATKGSTRADREQIKEGGKVWFFTPYAHVAQPSIVHDEQTGTVQLVPSSVREGGFWMPGGTVVKELDNDMFMVDIQAWHVRKKGFFSARRVFSRSHLKTKASRHISA